MENAIKLRKRLFEEMMQKETDPKNRENWEKLCCAKTPLVPFIGAGISAWCYPMWNDLLKKVVKDNFSDSCAAAVEKALGCRQKPFVEEEGQFHWMEEIAECIFDDTEQFPEGKRHFECNDPLPPEPDGSVPAEDKRLYQERKAATDILVELRACFQEYGPSKKRAAVNSLHDEFGEQRLLESGKNPEYQKFFPRIFNDILITTNYDKALERCYPSIFCYTYRDLRKEHSSKTSDGHSGTEDQSWLFRAVIAKLDQLQNRLDGKPVVAAGVSVPNNPMLLKLHGSIEQASDIALTRVKYDKVYHGEMPELFEELYKRSTLVFMGCGLREDRILDLMKKMRTDENCSSIHHFAFCAQPDKDEKETKEEKRKRLEEYGIYPIFYDKDSLKELFSQEERNRICHEYYLGLLLENLYRRKMYYPQPLELLWDKSRFKEWNLGMYLRNIRKRQLMKSESQYIHVEEARQIWSLLRASNECPLIAVIGRTGSGKSTFCQNLRQLDAEGKDAMQFFYIPLEDCKTWEEFCIQIYQVLNIIQPDILGPDDWRKVAKQVTERCGGYWRSVLILDHLDELKGAGKRFRQWETIEKMLMYWKEHQTRVVFTCRDYPGGINCHIWPIGTLTVSDAERVFFSACTSKQFQNVSYLERTVLENLFSRQNFRPASVHLLGRYANSKNDLTSLLEEWESCHLPGDSEAQTIARIFTRHLLSEHRYEEKTPGEQLDIAKNILWLWGILGTYPGRFPSVFFKNALRDGKGYRSMKISMDTLLYMKNAGICKEWSDERDSTLLENLFCCVEQFFQQLCLSESCCRTLYAFFEEAVESQGMKGLECFRGYSMDRYDGGLMQYVFEELKSELDMTDFNVEPPNEAILQLLEILCGQVSGSGTVNKQLNQALHYEIKTVIRFLLARLPEADRRDQQRIIKIGCGFSSYFHYVPSHAFPLVRTLLDILDMREDATFLNDRAKLYRVMGDIQRLLGKKKEALSSYQEAIRLCEQQIVLSFGKSNRQADYEECLRIKARTLIIRNYYADAADKKSDKDMEDALAIYDKLNDTWGKAYYYQRIGETLFSSGKDDELKKAVEKYNLAIHNYAMMGDDTGISYMLKCMGDLIREMKGNWEKEYRLTQENDTYCMIVTSNTSGIDDASKSWCYASVKCYALAFLMYSRQINWRGFANILQAMANTFRTRGAEIRGEESDEVYADRRQKRNQAVEDLYSLAEECYRWMGDIRGLADTLDFFGHYYEEQKREQYKDMARSKWMESRVLWERQGNDPKAALADKHIHKLSGH